MYKALKKWGNYHGLNTVVAVTKTWLTEKDDFKTLDTSPETHKCFKYDRKCEDKPKGGGILIYILFQFESKNLTGIN